MTPKPAPSPTPLTPEDVPTLQRLADYWERQDRLPTRVMAAQVRRLVYRLQDQP